MAISRHDAAAPARASVAVVTTLLALMVVALPLLGPEAATAEAAAAGPLAVIVVGPAGGMTSAYVREARQIAAHLKSYRAIVREIYSPNATWSRVTEASRGARLFVYLGRGNGYPAPDSVFDERTMNGLGLNHSDASGHEGVRDYGEYYVRRSLHLANGAVVILSHVPYAAGNSGPGGASPTRPTAARRADNYAAGFLGAGAAVVFANERSVASIVRDLILADRSMRSVFLLSATASTRHESTFTSARTPGSSGILAPYGPGQYYESVVGRLRSTTTDWRRTWTSVQVASIPALLTALANNSVTEIVVADGTYRVSPAASKRADSLWIGAKFATRTNPVTVRAETRGGVTFDGGGATYFGCISFQDGAHDQTWDGFNCAGGQATETGVVTFGGYAGLAAPHDITMRHITIAVTCTGRATTANGNPSDHAFYLAQAVGGPHDLLFEDTTVDGRGGLATAFHFYHSTATERNAWNVMIRRLHVSGTQNAIMLWDPTLRNIAFDTADITNALSTAVRYETVGATGIVLANITSTGSGSGRGFYSSQGAAPAGVTFINNSFR